MPLHLIAIYGIHSSAFFHAEYVNAALRPAVEA